MSTQIVCTLLVNDLSQTLFSLAVALSAVEMSLAIELTRSCASFFLAVWSYKYSSIVKVVQQRVDNSLTCLYTQLVKYHEKRC